MPTVQGTEEAEEYALLLCPLDTGHFAASGFNPWQLPHKVV